MASEPEFTTLEPDLIGVVRDGWKLIGTFAIALALLGLFLGSTRASEWRATASVVVEDPRTSTLFEGGSDQKPERYLETQIGILGSPAVASKASDVLAAGSPPVDLNTDEILASTVVAAKEFSDLITVAFTHGSAEVAELTANTIIMAYLELRRSDAAAGFSAALAELDASIASGEEEIRELDAAIAAISSGAPMTDLESQYAEAFASLDELRNSEEVVDPIEIQVISQQMNAIEAAIRIEGQQPELVALVEEQRLAMARLSSLIERRSEVAVDAELAGGGVVFSSLARPATRANPGTRVFAVVGFVLGAMVGVVVSYGFAYRRQRVDAPLEPELLLQAPFLGAIPIFADEIDTQLPVENSPDSQSAEAFRFVMAAVESQLSRPDVVPDREGEGRVPDRTVFVTSTAAEDGRSTVVANMALAAARTGRRVLVLDADFGTQGVTHLLLPEAEGEVGLTDVVLGTSTLESAINQVPLGPAMELFVLSRGSDVLSAQDLFSSSEVAGVVQRLRDDDFDLVFVDSPPFLEVGYATTLARLADQVLVVVRHRTLVSNLEDLRKRLSLIHSRDIGYVYNRAPGVSQLSRFGRHIESDSAYSDADTELPLASVFETNT